MPAPGAAVCAALHEVHLPAASPLHSLPAGHEAAQLRAQSEHHLVQQADIEVSGMDYRYRETRMLAWIGYLRGDTKKCDSCLSFILFDF